MKVSEGDEQPLAWGAILADTPTYSSDGEDVGVVVEVLGSESEDIFHGVVIRSGPSAEEVMVPAGSIARITNRRIEVTLNAEEVRQLPPYQAEESYRLGVVGRLRRHLGWVSDENREGPK